MTLIRIKGSRFLKGANLMASRTVLCLRIEVDGDDTVMTEALALDRGALDFLRAQPSGFGLAEAAIAALEMVEEAGDVVLGVAGDDAKAQFLFHNFLGLCNAAEGSGATQKTASPFRG